MNLRAAYTAALLQLPPLVATLVGMLAGFSGAAFPALQLGQLGIGAQVVRDGIVWGTLVTGLVLLGLGAALWVAHRFGPSSRTARRVSAALLVLCGPLAWAGVLAGAVTGAHLVGRAPWPEVLEHLARTWSSGSPLLLAAAASAAPLLLPREGG